MHGWGFEWGDTLVPPTQGQALPQCFSGHGDFWVTELIFKGSYDDSLLYSTDELCELWDQGIYLPTCCGKIPVLLAPSYHQAREPEVTKQSPPKVTVSDVPVESIKTTHTSGKGSTHHSLGHSSNTSTPKCQDSTSARKPSGSKEAP